MVQLESINLTPGSPYITGPCARNGVHEASALAGNHSLHTLPPTHVVCKLLPPLLSALRWKEIQKRKVPLSFR